MPKKLLDQHISHELTQYKKKIVLAFYLKPGYSSYEIKYLFSASFTSVSPNMLTPIYFLQFLIVVDVFFQEIILNSIIKTKVSKK